MLLFVFVCVCQYMILSHRFSVSFYLFRDSIPLSISPFLSFTFFFALVISHILSIFLSTYLFLCCFLLLPVCLSLCVYLCLAPFHSLPLSFSLSLCLSLSLSLSLFFSLSFSLSTCPPLSPSLRLPLTLPLSFSLSSSLCHPSPLFLSLSPSLSHPAPLSPFPPHLFISVLLLVSLSPGRYLHIRRPGYTSGTAFIAQRLRVQAARVITRPDRHLSTAVRPASFQVITFDT